MSTTTEQALSVTVETLTCGECGVVFSVPRWWVAERRSDHRSWYCPNGHCRAFKGETKEERRIRELEAEQVRLSRVATEYREDYELEAQARQQVQRSLAATKGVLTKTRKRVAHGVCPCCQRTFSQLARHMAEKHPEFAATTPTPESEGA